LETSSTRCNLTAPPLAIDELGLMPVKVVNGSTIYLRDVAGVHDGSAPQTDIVHVDDSRSVLMTVLKNGSASTWAIVDGIRERIGTLKGAWPGALKVLPVNDQSLFVRAAIKGMVLDGALAAALTSVMILLFRAVVARSLSLPCRFS